MVHMNKIKGTYMKQDGYDIVNQSLNNDKSKKSKINSDKIRKSINITRRIIKSMISAKRK